MTALSIARDGSHLLRDGQFWPYVADTAWSAFADATEAEWVHYLSRRRAQGFTSVAVSILPILHDRTLRPGGREPFAVDEQGHYLYTEPVPGYFANARRFTELALQHGIVPTLIIMWVNYLPGTWAADRTPWAVMPPAERTAYVSLVTDTFGPMRPILSLSGDDSFTSEPANRAYREVLAQVTAEAPDCLVTVHSNPDARLPEDIAGSPDLDFFTYQSGHELERQDRCFELAQLYRRRSVRKPVVNLEPAYERHGYGGGAGRYTAADVRKAVWWSVVGGASAGIGYGAHGIWQWHREGGTFTSPGFSMEPFPWQYALAFRGADDVGLAAELLRRHRLDRLDANQGLLLDDTGGVRAGASADGNLVVVYQPFARQMSLALDLTGHRVHAWDLENRSPVTVQPTVADRQTVIAQQNVIADLLVVFER